MQFKTTSLSYLLLISYCLMINVSFAQVAPTTTSNQIDPTQSIDLRTFQPTMDSQGFMSTERSVGIDTGKMDFGLFVDYAFNPLTQSINNQKSVLVDKLAAGQLSWAIGLFNRITLGISQTLVIVHADPDGPGIRDDFSADGLGDTRFRAKGIIFDSRYSPVGLSLMLDTAFAFGQVSNYTSYGQKPLILPWLIVDGQSTYFSWGLNLGFKSAQLRSIADPVTLETGMQVPRANPISVGQEGVIKLAGAIRYIPDFFEQNIEIYTALPLASGAQRGTLLEVMSGFRLHFNSGSHLTLGGGLGILDAYATPAPRLFMGVTYHPKPSDKDGDGIFDDVDQCIEQKEDFDKWEDQDGCPDPDNDFDGIEDLYDQCVNEKEDINQFEDEDGCPDGNRDIDRDGIIDSKDKCVNEPEDKDLFADEDGCPDPDNDRDMIKDKDDKCPINPEDSDLFEDEDGCPDPDNDKDRILDERDECPNDPEDYDGDKDQDGCPDLNQNVVIKKDKLDIKGTVYFETSKAIIKKESYALLLEIALILNQHPELGHIQIEGHTDDRGNFDKNMVLSQQRAESVMKFLIDEGSVEAKRLSAKGYGSTQPVVFEKNKEAWSKNRRVEFKIEGLNRQE